jgi:hypothetical protein
MSAPARELKTRFPTLASQPFRLNVALRELPSNDAPTAAPAQLGGTSFSLRLEWLLLARVAQTYTTSEWFRCASRALLNLLRTTRWNLSTPVISRSATVAALFSCVTLVNSFSFAAAAPSQYFNDDPSGQASIPKAPELSLLGGAQHQEKTYGTVSGRVVDQDGNGIVGPKCKSRATRNPRFRKCNPMKMADSTLTVSRQGPFNSPPPGRGS